MNMNLTEEQAFVAMFIFLERYYELTSAEPIGDLLGGMQTLADGGTADPAAWNDWCDCVKHVVENSEGLVSIRSKWFWFTSKKEQCAPTVSTGMLTEQQAYVAMYHFLELYYSQVSSKEVKKLLKNMATRRDNSTNDPSMWSDWMRSVNRVVDYGETMQDIRLQF